MKHNFQIDRDKNIITETFEGEVTLADLNEANQNILNHPDFIIGLNFLTDFRSARLHMDYDKMSQYVCFHTELDKNKVAIIADKDNEFGLARMYEMLSEQESLWKEFKVFRNKEEAEKWLTL